MKHIDPTTPIVVTRRYSRKNRQGTKAIGHVEVDGEQGFPTPKPVAIVGRMIRSSTPLDAWVLEPFGGSGTTLIAAEKTARRCAIMELKPAWCDVIRDRYARLTG